MNEGETSIETNEGSGELHLALMDCIAGVMLDIERVKQERSADEVRAARTQLAALHGVARLRRNVDHLKTA